MLYSYFIVSLIKFSLKTPDDFFSSTFLYLNASTDPNFLIYPL